MVSYPLFVLGRNVFPTFSFLFLKLRVRDICMILYELYVLYEKYNANIQIFSDP
jgi:hypothetical protein